MGVRHTHETPTLACWDKHPSGLQMTITKFGKASSSRVYISIIKLIITLSKFHDQIYHANNSAYLNFKIMITNLII